MLVQNLEKANAQLTEFLIAENAAGWELRKHLAKRAGERANSLLLIPILLIFIGIMVMILVPMLSNLGI
jgi:tight adherence protein C